MNAFIESAESRETSSELMQAIFEVAGRDEAAAEKIWEDGPNDAERCAIVNLVTKNGAFDVTEFVWGASGTHWSV